MDVQRLIFISKILTDSYKKYRYFLIEDCWEHCEGKLCNDNLDISKNFQPGPGEDSVTECHTCKHEEIIDGQVSDIEIEDFYDCKVFEENIKFEYL